MFQSACVKSVFVYTHIKLSVCTFQCVCVPCFQCPCIMLVCVLPDHVVCTDDKLWFGVPLVVCDVIVCL